MEQQQKHNVLQFDDLHTKFATFIHTDPMRLYLQYVPLLEKVALISNPEVLDIGCGDGTFARLLAQQTSSRLIGYDASPLLVATAHEGELKHPSGAKFVVSEPEHFKLDKQVDIALSCMVLCYAKDAQHLKTFFHSAWEHLKLESGFVSVTFNPLFAAFGEQMVTRRFERKGRDQVEVNFTEADTGATKLTAVLTQYTREEYEVAARAAGFSKVEWRPLYPSQAGIAKCGKAFWKNCVAAQPYTLLACRK